MLKCRFQKSLILTVFLLTICSSAYPYSQPDPAKTFYGDATGDQQLQLDDLPMHKSQVYLGTPTYNTPQLNNVDDRWNTCDVTGDFKCQLDDMTPLKAAVYLTALAKNWDSWEIVNISFPATANVGEAKSFQISPRAVSGGVPNARPGIIVKLTVAANSPVQNVILGGRPCPVVDPKCAVSVGITAWLTSTALAPTETGTAEFSFTANAAGNLILVAEFAAQPSMKIAATSTRLSTTVNLVNHAPTFTNIPTTKSTFWNGGVVHFSINASDPEYPSQTLTFSMVSENCAGTPTVTTNTPAPSAEFHYNCSTVETCSVNVKVTDNGTNPPNLSDTDTVTIRCINNAPYFTSTGPTSVQEGSQYLYTIRCSDPDGDRPYIYKSPYDTCGGTLIDSTYIFETNENSGGASCTVGVYCTDTKDSVFQNTSVNILENNQPPVISNVPATISKPVGQTFNFDANAADPDVPADALTFSIGTNTCSFTPTINSSTGVGSLTCGVEAETCNLQVTVTDDGTPPPALSDSEFINVSCYSNPTFVGAYVTGAINYGVFVAGGYAYMGSDALGLKIINVTNPASPVLVGTYDTPNSAGMLTVAGGYAYLTDFFSGLKIINVSNPASPTLAGAYDTPDFAWDVELGGGYAYVGDGYSGLQIIRVTNPSSPILAGSYNTSGTAFGVFLAGGYAYVADGTAGLNIINVSNPASPTLVSAYSIPGTSYGVSVAGGYAYVAAGDAGLHIIDVSNLASPTLVGTYNTPGTAFDVVVSGDRAYVADQSFGLQVIDVSNPASPVFKNSYDTPGNAWAVKVAGDYAYVADDTSGLQIIQVKYPVAPVFAGNCYLPDAFSVHVSGKYAYLADTISPGLHIVDVSNPYSPTLAGSYITPGGASGVFVSGGYAYMADNNYTLQIIDVANPASPTLAGTYDNPAYPSEISLNVYVSGNYAYVAERLAGLQIINVSNPAAPTLVGTYIGNGGGGFFDVYVSGNYAYATDYVSGLQVINLSDPASPILSGYCDLPDYAYGVYVSGNYAFVANGTEGLKIIDVSNPTLPTLVGTYDTNFAFNVYVSGKYAYVADFAAGIQIIDVSNPASPSFVNSYDTPAVAVDIFQDGNYVFVADSTLGLQVIRITYP